MISGLIVFIIAVTGCIYVFSEDIKSLVYKDRREVSVPKNGQLLPISQLLKTADSSIHFQYPCQSITIPQQENNSIAFTYRTFHEDAFGYHRYMEFYKTVYVNPYSGNVIKVENTKWEFFNVNLWLHLNLLLGYNHFSHTLIVGSMWIFVLMMISGLILWWPKRKQRKQSFSFRWNERTRWKRKNYDLHKILGFYVVAIGLLFALTGLLWASESFNKSVKWIANGGDVITEKKTPAITKLPPVSSPLDSAVHQTRILSPEYQWIFIRLPQDTVRPYSVRSYPHEYHNYKRVVYYFDQKSSELTNVETFSGKNNGDKIQALNYDLHVGTIGGLPTKIIAFIASLIIASLPVTGFLLWWGRKFKSFRRS